MADRSESLESARYRSLYLLLPFANGVLLIAGYEFVHGYLGVPEISWLAGSNSIGEAIAHYLWLGLEYFVAGTTIYCANLLVLGAIYRRNFFRSRRQILGAPEGRPDTQLDVVASAALTFAGYFAASIVFNAFSFWPETEDHVTLFIAIVVSFLYPHWILPLMIYSERTQAGGDRAAGG